MTFALPLPNGRQQFIDRNGAPLVGGFVYHYVPGTLVARDTWQDYAASILNTNPIQLDALGSAAIWGIGRYRQIVTDSLGNQVWDEETAALTDRPYEAGFYFAGAPIAGNVVGVWNFTQDVAFPTNFAGSVGRVNLAPVSDTVLQINRVTSSATSTIGAMNVSTLGVVTFSSLISDPAFAAGDAMEWVVQGGGANSLQGPSATMLGSLA